MPELPEAETIARVLNGALSGRSLPGYGPLLRVWRHGKGVIFEFSAMRLVARLGMTGLFRIHGAPGPHTRQILPFEGLAVFYDDIRKFGRLAWTDTAPVIGPDILAMDPQEFARRLLERRRAIKPLLLDQTFASGLGNIYVDEALFRASVHPLESASRVNGAQLHSIIVELLSEAVAAGGSTISDFVDPLGREGRFQDDHQVYGRAGLPCPVCGTPVQRLRVAQRGTHYCPRCQPAPAEASR